MKFLSRVLTLAACLLFLAISCKKGVKQDAPSVPAQQQIADLSTKVNSSVSGFVTDQNDAPLSGAMVKAGSISIMTDHYGYFELKNTMLVKQAAVVTVEYTGYFKGIKTFIATEGNTAFVRIKLIQKTIAGTIQSGSGGSVLLPNGLSIMLPSDAVKLVSSGSSYSGLVNVAAQWIDPTAADLNMIMPGDLRGINTEGFIKYLTTYGMAAVELTGSGGELLQMADGKKATISFPLPASISGFAPSAIPLWYFDENTGVWNEEGQATKQGTNYIGEVAHFSFWNCDAPGNYVEFSATISDSLRNPLVNSLVKIGVVNSNAFSYGYTDANGYVNGLVPANTQLRLELFGDYNCAVPVYTQNFITTNTNYSAGTINIPAAGVLLTSFSGVVTNCSGAPVTNGYVMILMNGQYTRYVLNGNGNYSFSNGVCGSAAIVSIFGFDLDSLKQSTTVNYTLTPGMNIISNLQTCGLAPVIYDGKYKMSGYHNRDPYTFPYIDVPMEMITTGPNAVAFYWPEMSDFGHPIGVAPSQLNWYGNTLSPAIAFDQGTNEVIDVYNISGGGAPITLYNGSIPTHSYYDPATRKIYVAWQYNNNTLRAFFDTLTYTGPR